MFNTKLAELRAVDGNESKKAPASPADIQTLLGYAMGMNPANAREQLYPGLPSPVERPPPASVLTPQMFFNDARAPTGQLLMDQVNRAFITSPARRQEAALLDSPAALIGSATVAQLQLRLQQSVAEGTLLQQSIAEAQRRERVAEEKRAADEKAAEEKEAEEKKEYDREIDLTIDFLRSSARGRGRGRGRPPRRGMPRVNLDAIRADNLDQTTLRVCFLFFIFYFSDTL